MSQAASQRRVGTNLTTGPIMKSLLLFAFPIVLTNLVQQLYSMVDLIVIGQYVGSVGTVGVNTGGEMADLVSPVAMGFATAGQIFIAQLVGAGDDRRIKRTVGTLLSFTTLLAVLLAAAAILFCRPILQLLNCPQEALFEAESYMIITALGYPFIFGYNAICGVLRGMGESKRPLIFILIAAAINIVLDIVLVAVFRLDAAGTAIATALSQMGSCVAAFIFLWKRREHFDFELKPSYFRMDKEILAVLIRLGIPQVVRSMFVRIGMLWVNANANSFGLVVSATNSVGNKLQKFLEVFVQGIDTASASMVGQNLGRKEDRPRRQDHPLHLHCRHLLCCGFQRAVSADPPRNFPPVHHGRSGNRIGCHLPAHLHPAFLRIGADRFVPGYGYRLRLCGAGIYPRPAGRHPLQDRLQYAVHECVPDGLHRPVVGRCLLPHSARLHLCGLLPQRPLENPQAAGR